ncbi:MAG: glycerol-3-phosphate 1-O-acyltransferase PlsY [Acidobacteriota bacterium]
MAREMTLALAYLLGSIPFALLVVKAAGRGDVRTVGSGNVGATNAMRAAGWKWALLVALLDVGKGLAAVLLMRQVTANPAWITAAGALAVVGHCFPVWLKFSGGKGVATAGGVFFTLAWLPTLVVAGVWIVILALTRIVSASSVVAAASFPVGYYLIARPSWPELACAVLVALVIIWRHRPNLGRLARGEEPRLGAKGKRG